MPRHDRDGLRRIHRTAAAQADYTVMATRLQRGQSGQYHLIGRVGDYAIEHRASDVALGQTLAHPVGNPLTHHDLVGDDKRTVRAPDPREDIRKQVQAALADLQDARYADSYRFPHLPSSLLEWRLVVSPRSHRSELAERMSIQRENPSHFAEFIQCRMIDPQ